ncbi:hypothetical protein [Actinokineospora iranica]|uniref:Uncharacterized protein n=1 Tax=Actinokineospora iranica TaxID=1271860 RepID=A0A1G6W7Y4_9PSEU|nr:hypothetical protein [Actinokineospora iranica]SDD61337.1 hypothetical protein SAMN05216174_11432 [Actinokineospora iranica]
MSESFMPEPFLPAPSGAAARASVRFRRSTLCTSGACVEIAVPAESAALLIGDGHGGVLSLPSPSAFLAQIKLGRFDAAGG